MNPIARTVSLITTLILNIRTADRAAGDDGYTLETVLIVSGLAALAIAVVAGIGVAVAHYLSTIH
jgi:hypothetical protein